MMRVRGPHLRAIDEEVVAHVDRSRLDRRQIGAVIRLRQPLTPDFIGRWDARDIAFLLFGGSPLHQRRAHSRDALKVDYRWRLGAVEFLVVDELLKERSAAPAVFFGPVDAHPARAVELAMPIA